MRLPLLRHVQDQEFTAVINAAQENPFCEDATGIGNALLTLSDGELCIALSYVGLSSPELFSHIHGPAEPGENADVIFALSDGSSKFDCFPLSRRQQRELIRGLWYFNIHSENCPPGEIRGQILPVG